MNLDHATRDAQRRQMEEIAAAGICPFCREHFEANHEAPILHESEYWIVTKNDYPYEGTTEHLLLVYKHHVATPGEMVPEAWRGLGDAMRWIAAKSSTHPGGAFFMRFGDTEHTGATITHLHAHVIYGVPKQGAEKLLVHLGYRKQ